MFAFSLSFSRPFDQARGAITVPFVVYIGKTSQSDLFEEAVRMLGT